MLRLSALNVGHGLCVHVASHCADGFLYDCGTHGSPRARTVPPAWRAVSSQIAAGSVRAIAVSHLHWDHYCGFLEPLAVIAQNASICFARLPRIVDAPTPRLRFEFAARLLAWGPLSPHYGPLDIDLVRRVQYYAPRAQPKVYSAGDALEAGGATWDVLWPPPEIRLGQTGLRLIEEAIRLYDDAAEQNPELERRLEQVRESDTYAALMSEHPEPFVDEVLDDDPENAEASGPEDLGPADQHAVGTPAEAALEAAGRALAGAANPMSLILESRETPVLLTGDATRSAVTAALKHSGTTAFAAVVTPHHGGTAHHPAALKRVSSQWWISSAGAAMSSKIGGDYDVRPGLHLRTDKGGDVYLMLHGTATEGMHRGWSAV